MSVTLQAAVLLGKVYTENLRSTKNQLVKSLRQIFQVTERLITDQTEITGLTTADWQIAKTFGFSDSVLCLGGISDEPIKTWEIRITWFLETRCLKDLDPIDGEPMEFEWKNLSGFTTFGILDEVQKMISELKCEPEQLKGRIIFMSMYNDIDWTTRGNKGNCIANALRVIEYVRRFTQGHWSFLGLGSEKEWYGPMHTNPMENGMKLLKA